MNDRIPPAPGKSKLGEEWSALAADATRLPDPKFLKIYTLLEQVGDHPDIRGAFDTLRPRLVELRPPRRPSLSRLFFRPAEDLLDDAGSYSRKLNRVCRTSLGPCWKALKERLDPATLATAQSGLTLADPRDRAAQAKACEALWVEGAVALAALVADCNANLKLKVGLFGRDDDVLRQLDTLRQAIEIGPELEALKAALPEKPIGQLAESHVDVIRQTLVRLGQEDARKTTPALLVLTSRMKRPGDLLKLLSDLRLGGAAQEKEALTKEMSGYVVGNLLRQTADFERAMPQDGGSDPDSLAATAERLTEGLNSVNDTVMSLRDKEMSQKVQGARAEIGSFVVRNVVADLDRTLVGTLFTADGSLPVDDGSMKKAEQLALALRRSSKLAPHLGIQKEVGAKITAVRKQLEAQTETLLRTGPRTRDGLAPEAQRQMFNSLRVIEILAGSDEAERLYKEWRNRMR